MDDGGRVRDQYRAGRRIDTKSGRIDGYASDVPHPGNLNAVKVVTIDAGTVGCPAVSP